MAGAGLGVDNGIGIPVNPSLSALEAEDMLATNISDTEKVIHPNVVDNGLTHMDNNGTDSNKSINVDQNGEQNCSIALDLLKNCLNNTVNVRLSGNLSTSNDSHLLPCTVLKENNTSYFDCSIPKEWLMDVNSSSHIKCPVEEEILKNMNNRCSVTSQPAPRFNCTDKSDENFIISDCTIPTSWLKTSNLSTWLNCTSNPNASSATCFVSAPKKLNCTTNNMTDTICFVSKKLANHNFFLKLNCTNSNDTTEDTCLFPKKLILDYKINCVDVKNSTNKICDIPKESVLNDVDKKFNCTSDGENSNLKTCIMELNVTKSVNSNTSLTQGDINEHICPIPVEWLLPNNTFLNCTDKANATFILCRAPSDWMKNKKNDSIYDCPIPKNVQQPENLKMRNCTLNYSNSSVILKCPTSGDNISVSVIENSSASGQLNIITAPPSSNSSNLKNTLNSTDVSTSASPIQGSTIPPENPINKTSNKNDSTVISTTTEQSHNITTLSTFDTKTDQITKKSTEISTPKSTTATPDSTTISSVTSTATPTQTNSSVAAFTQQHQEVTTDTREQSTAFLRPTESAAILVGVFIAVAALGYVGLLVWRRVLERRYGNRQLLINEDDDLTNSNNFEL